MASVEPYEPVVYFCALLARTDFPIEMAEAALERRFGEIDLRCGPWPFSETDYYSEQMGGELARSFVSFGRPGSPEHLPEAKQFTNKLEVRLARGTGQRRPVNIDPGYLNLAQMVLASAKPFAHRVPLRGGIHAQLEYLFHRKGIEFLRWTFPEYRRPEVVEYFIRVRERYRQLAQIARGGTARGG
jgi:hypothetical protein